ncbi:MAG: ERAP1-like C-terminal domain-containing protein [Gemmatimonadetes bacterium]|nr:ERAP1-like C-terminal domain-containing protein [Gemmatimonadota bacterium]
MQPGVARELARVRAATLSGVSYDLSLDVTRRDTAVGAVAIGFDRRADAGDLVLDFRGPELRSLAVNGVPVTDHVWSRGHVLIPARHLRAGRNRVEARFTARIAQAGAPVIRVDDARDGATYLYTLLVPSDANALFPAFDQPDLKARFRVEIVASAGWKVLANGPLAGREAAPGGTRWRFAATEPISTYLAAFAAGPWTTREPRPGEGRPITLYARASRRGEVDADTLVRIDRDAVGWLERYFGVPFPFAKFDMLLAPAFPFGGMEHVGAVFYNENSFVFREPPTLNERLGRKATIYHEVAHQWFGDLVTMRWFDDLWLKEGFATYMAAKMQDELDPGSEAWKTFYLRNKPLAYGVDATAGTTPVWQELDNLDQAKSNYGPIVYNKAPAILKQLNYLVGEDAFRRGLGIFLRRHAYGNVTWQELLSALEEASGQSLKAFGEQYILRAGMPVVETELAEEGGRVRRLALTQHPARDLPGDPGGWWPGRVRVRLAYHDRPDTVLDVAFAGPATEVAAAAGLPAPDYVWANQGDYGYGLFLLDPRSAGYVLLHVGETRDGLERAMLWGALWDLVREARLSPAEYLAVSLRELPREQDEQIAATLLGRASTALTRYLRDDQAAALLPAWERLLLARSGDASLPYGLRKASLDAFLGLARTPEARAALREYLAGTRRFDGQPLRQPSRWAAVQQLVSLGDPAADSLLRAETARDTTAEGARRAFVAGAARPTAEAKAEYFRRYLDDPTLNEEWVTASLGAFNDPAQAALVLPYLRSSLEKLEWIRDNRRIFFLPRWVETFVRGQTDAAGLAAVDAFLAEHPQLPADLRRKVLQSRDELERTVRIRERP